MRVERVVCRESPRLEAILCRPAGQGPFPAVIYNHGGLGQAVGGDLKGTCRALARAGYIGLAPERRKTRTLQGHPEDVLAGLQYLRGRKDVDPKRIAMIGFSRGGLLSYLIATRQPELRAFVLMAPASGRGALERNLGRAGQVRAPVLILVSKNDSRQADHVALARKIEGALQSAGKEVRLILYPPFGSDGHRLFFEVGAYWKDVLAFLAKHLRP